MEERPLIRAHSRLAGSGDADLSVRLGHDDRHRRRLAVTATSGERVLIDLAETTRLGDGDRLALEDGRILRIDAEPEAVADIVALPLTLIRLAWHLGNRHTPTAAFAERLRIRRDHVLEAMVEGLGGRVEHAVAPFDPEFGAYHDGHDGHGQPGLFDSPDGHSSAGPQGGAGGEVRGEAEDRSPPGPAGGRDTAAHPGDDAAAGASGPKYEGRPHHRVHATGDGIGAQHPVAQAPVIGSGELSGAEDEFGQ